MSAIANPAVFRISSVFAKIVFTCVVTSPSTGWLDFGSRDTWPEMNSVSPAWMAWLYGLAVDQPAGAMILRSPPFGTAITAISTSAVGETISATIVVLVGGSF